MGRHVARWRANRASVCLPQRNLNGQTEKKATTSLSKYSGAGLDTDYRVVAFE